MFDVMVSVDGGAYHFIASNSYSTIQLVSVDKYAVLTRSGSTGPFTLRQSNGTVTVFTASNRPSTITRTDGSTFTLTYDGSASDRIRSVTSNRGYALVFEYTGSNSNYITKACTLNLAQTIFVTTCPAGVPTVSYAYPSNGMTITAADGGV